MMQAIALAITEFTKTNELTFVSLVSSTLKDDHYIFDFNCPYPRLIELIKNLRAVSSADVASIGDLNIRHKFSLVDGLLMPLVFWYQPQQRELLVTNENQLQYPDRFLEPGSCRTTSGLLNFLGTLLFLDKADTARIESIIAQANTAVDQEDDEWLRWLYCLVDTRTLCETKRIMIDPEKPEQYSYSYPD
jgi:hypothetical protein